MQMIFLLCIEVLDHQFGDVNAGIVKVGRNLSKSGSLDKSLIFAIDKKTGPQQVSTLQQSI